MSRRPPLDRTRPLLLTSGVAAVAVLVAAVVLVCVLSPTIARAGRPASSLSQSEAWRPKAGPVRAPGGDLSDGAALPPSDPSATTALVAATVPAGGPAPGVAVGANGLAPLPSPGGAESEATASRRVGSAAEGHGAAADPPPTSPGRDGAIAEDEDGSDAGCRVEPVTPGEGFDSFYGQVCWVLGLPVLASADVDPEALVAAGRIVSAVLAPRPDLLARLIDKRMRIGVLGTRQRAVDLPEYRDLPTAFPATNWDNARAYSATAARPLLTAPEENLTCSSVDTYPGQQVLVHELGHSVLDLAVRAADPTMWDRVRRAYDEATAAGRWVGYYGGTSATEYWAEGVQAYFDASHVTPGPDPVGTPVGTRAELSSYDPALFALVRSVFGDNPWRASCP